MVIQVIHFLFCNPLDEFAPCPRKWGSSGPTVVQALHKWLNAIFSQTTEASNGQIYTDIFLEGLCIFSRYDVISYFWLAAISVHVTATIADYIVTKQSFWRILETARASNIKIYHNIALDKSLRFEPK